MVKLFFSMLLICSLIPAPAISQQLGLIDHTRAEEFDFSVLYSYSRADFSPDDSSLDNQELINQILGLRVNFRVSPQLQVYGLFGTTDTEFGDDSFDDGKVLGLGFQFLIEDDPDLYMKLTGNFANHDKQDQQGGAGELEITSDWQLGFLLGRQTSYSNGSSRTDSFHTYTGLLYSRREVDFSNGPEASYELDKFSGLSATAGILYDVTDYLSLELEGQAGAIEAITGSFNYYF